MAGKGNITLILDAEVGKAIQGFLQVLQAQNRLTGAAKKTAQSQVDMGKAMGWAAHLAVRDLARMMLGWRGLFKVIEMANAELELFKTRQEEFARRDMGFEDAFRVLKTLTPELVKIPADALRKQIVGVAKEAGVEPTESIWGRVAVESILPKATPAEKQAVMKEAVEWRKITTVPLEDLAKWMADIRNIFTEEQGIKRTANQLQNMLYKTVALSRVTDPRELTEFVGPALKAGPFARMTPEQTLGTLSFLTRKTGTPAQAVSGMRFMRKLMTEERMEDILAEGLDLRQAKKQLLTKKMIITQAGIDVGKDSGAVAMEKLFKWWKAAGKESRDALKKTFGERTMEFAYVISTAMKEWQDDMRQVADVTKPGVDIVRDALDASLRDPRYRAFMDLRKEPAEKLAVSIAKGAVPMERLFHAQQIEREQERRETTGIVSGLQMADYWWTLAVTDRHPEDVRHQGGLLTAAWEGAKNVASISPWAPLIWSMRAAAKILGDGADKADEGQAYMDRQKQATRMPF